MAVRFHELKNYDTPLKYSFLSLCQVLTRPIPGLSKIGVHFRFLHSVKLLQEGIFELLVSRFAPEIHGALTRSAHRMGIVLRCPFGRKWNHSSKGDCPILRKASEVDRHALCGRRGFRFTV